MPTRALYTGVAKFSVSYTFYFIDKKVVGSPYMYDPDGEKTSGNRTTKGSAIYDHPTAIPIWFKMLFTKDVSDAPRTRPLLGRGEIGALLTATFDEYAVDTTNNKILAYKQWLAYCGKFITNQDSFNGSS